LGSAGRQGAKGAREFGEREKFAIWSLNRV
jgi:hypothetical protein